MKKKILIIGYGGTIVMVVDEANKSVIPAKNLDQIMSLIPRLEEAADISMEMLSNKDSTNVTPNDWVKLASFVHERLDKYDGFVITHGTNTLAYTASALALSLGPNLSKPVVITGAQLPLTVYGNDARFNFENAVKTAVVASEKGLAEVMVVFNDVILRGSRTVKVSESNFKAFESPAFPELGVITSTGIHFSSLVQKAPKGSGDVLKNHFNTNIISIDLSPGLHPSTLEAFVSASGCRGVILKSYGAGSVPTLDEYSLLPFIQRTAKERKIPVIVSTKFLGGNASKEINDECAVLAIQAGAIPAGDLTDVMTEVKLMWLLAQGFFSIEDIKRELVSNRVGEITEMGH